MTWYNRVMYSLIHYSKSINRLSKYSSKNRAFHIKKKKKKSQESDKREAGRCIILVKRKKNRDKRKSVLG